MFTTTICSWAGMSNFESKSVRLFPNWTNLRLFKISFSTFWLGEPKWTETDLKKSQISPNWGQYDPIYITNMISVYKTTPLDLGGIFRIVRLTFLSHCFCGDSNSEYFRTDCICTASNLVLRDPFGKYQN